MPAGRGRLVFLATFATLAEARQVARQLKGAGVRSFIRGEAAAVIAATPAPAGVLVEVAEEDLEYAQRILAAVPEPEPAPSRQSDEPVSPNSPATVEVFYDALDAKHAADLLRAHGIPCSLQGTSQGIIPWLGSGTTGLRLEVRERDLERAYEVLGFTADDGGGEEISRSGNVAPGNDGIREAEGGASRQIERPPFRQPEAEDSPGMSPVSPVEGLRPQFEEPKVEAASGGVDIGLVLVLLLIAGVVFAAAVMLLFG